jgi:hypothetical protein
LKVGCHVSLDYNMYIVFVASGIFIRYFDDGVVWDVLARLETYWFVWLSLCLFPIKESWTSLLHRASSLNVSDGPIILCRECKVSFRKDRAFLL